MDNQQQRPRGITQKQRVFIHEYLRDFNATQAAIRAGYSAKTARSIGQENLTKDYIAQEVNTRLTSLSVKMPEEVANKKKTSKPNHLYLIQEDFCGLVKIGITSDPLRRLNALQTSCPQRLTLLVCAKIDDAAGIEAMLHVRYSDKHFGGEWFRLSSDDVDTLRQEWQS